MKDVRCLQMLWITSAMTAIIWFESWSCHILWVCVNVCLSEWVISYLKGHEWRTQKTCGEISDETKVTSVCDAQFWPQNTWFLTKQSFEDALMTLLDNILMWPSRIWQLANLMFLLCVTERHPDGSPGRLCMYVLSKSSPEPYLPVTKCAYLCYSQAALSER